ncbi:MAG: DUF5654 family protein [bacterium]
MLQTGESITGLLTYAILATVIAIVVLMLLARAASKIGGEAVVTREAEGYSGSAMQSGSFFRWERELPRCTLSKTRICANRTPSEAMPVFASAGNPARRRDSFS